MPVDSSATYTAGPDAVLALLTDRTFLRDRAQRSVRSHWRSP